MKLLVTALAGLLTLSTTAQASYLSPSLGVASTLAEVGSQDNYTTFTVNSAVGTPGTTVANYSPKAFTGPVTSSVTATAQTLGLPYYTINSTGLASADLATGQLKVGAGDLLNQTDIEGEQTPFAAGTASQAALSDVLTFVGNIPTPVTIHLSMTIDGSITASGLGEYPVPNDSTVDIGAFSLATNQGIAEVFVGNLQGGALTFTNESGLGGHLSVLSANASSIQMVLTEDLTISNANRTVLFEATALAAPISPSSYGGVIADFEHTAALSVDMPAGLTFTSLSGVFLTQPQDDDSGSTNVPEPAGALPLLLPLATLVGSRARRQARGNCCSTSVAQ